MNSAGAFYLRPFRLHRGVATGTCKGAEGGGGSCGFCFAIFRKYSKFSLNFSLCVVVF